MQLLKHLFLFIVGSILFTSCGIYSFTGASIPTEAKTVVEESLSLFDQEKRS